MVILSYKSDWKDIKVFMNTLLLSAKKQQQKILVLEKANVENRRA